jgi:hypothetical protein
VQRAQVMRALGVSGLVKTTSYLTQHSSNGKRSSQLERAQIYQLRGKLFAGGNLCMAQRASRVTQSADGARAVSHTSRAPVHSLTTLNAPSPIVDAQLISNFSVRSTGGIMSTSGSCEDPRQAAPA